MDLILINESAIHINNISKLEMIINNNLNIKDLNISTFFTNKKYINDKYYIIKFNEKNIENEIQIYNNFKEHKATKLAIYINVHPIKTCMFTNCVVYFF